MEVTKYCPKQLLRCLLSERKKTNRPSPRSWSGWRQGGTRVLPAALLCLATRGWCSEVARWLQIARLARLNCVKWLQRWKRGWTADFHAEWKKATQYFFAREKLALWDGWRTDRTIWCQ